MLILRPFQDMLEFLPTFFAAHGGSRGEWDGIAAGLKGSLPH